MKNLKTDTFIALQKFISGFCGISVNKIRLDSKLEGDLGIYGDDAVDLIIAYSKKYHVDINQFLGRDFIAPEGDTVLPSLLKMFTKSEKKRSDLTISNLVDGIVAGRLDKQIINS